MVNSTEKVWHKGMIAALEPRVMYDGAAIATAADVLADAGDGDSADSSGSAGEGVDSPDAVVDVSAAAEAAAVVEALGADRSNEVAFIDASVTDADSLLAALGDEIQVVQLDADAGLSEIAAWLADNPGMEAVHILSHGEAGELTIGGDILTVDSVDDYTGTLEALGQSLSADADILIYGCDVAAGDDGTALIDALAEATGADVAASVDDTGADDLGGDWDLEKVRGTIEATPIRVAGVYRCSGQPRHFRPG